MCIDGSSMTGSLDISFPKFNQHSCQSMEEFSTTLNGLSLDGSQLSKGDFNAHTNLLTAGTLQLAIRSSEAKHFQNATIASGKIAMIFPLIQDEHISNGKLIGPERQYLILHGDENRIIFPKDNKHVSLIFDTDNLKKYLSEDEAEQFIKTYKSISTGVVSSDQKLLLTQKLYNLYQDLKQLNENTELNPTVYEDAYASLFHSLNTYQEAHSPKIFERVKNNERLLARALDFIHSEPLHNLSVSHLVSNIHASSRSIQYCFSDLLGMTPKKYLIRLRLNAIRKELNAASPTERTITNIANNYGVVNIGRFKQDYQKFFNESPRETLFST